MKLTVIFLFLISYSTLAENIDNRLCNEWSKREGKIGRYDLSLISEDKAKASIKMINGLLENKSFNPKWFGAYDEAEFYVKGYLLKVELEKAWRNRQHDADEIGALCKHWIGYEQYH
ncbi:hypothetical protein [Shewanella seohaensis]|uniref:hypothetical protein n=1 Tax=Shewanella seohaensis TaxID=755175 RepID=UPI0035B7FA7D